MSRILFRIGLFSLGLVLSIPLLLLGGFASVNSLKLVAEDASIASRSMFKGSSAIETLIPREERLEILTDAVKDATLDSLQLIRKDHLQYYPGYRSTILPALKAEAIVTLLKLFDPFDWKHWKDIRSGKRTNTAAGQFVVDLILVNKELGVFTDTAAYLLQDLKKTTESGHHFDVSKSLLHLVSTAPTTSSQWSLVPERSGIDINIIQDPVFVAELERERCLHTKAYIANNIPDVQSIITLLHGVDVARCDSGLAEKVEDFIRHLSVTGSHIMRKRVYYNASTVAVLMQLAANNVQLRLTLAEFYILGALDELDRHRPNQAIQFLSASKEIYPALRSQADVEYRIEKMLGRSLNNDGLVDEENSSFLMAQGKKSKVGVAWITFLIVGAFFAGFIFWRRMLARRRSLEAYNSDFIYEDQDDMDFTENDEEPQPLAKVVNIRRH